MTIIIRILYTVIIILIQVNINIYYLFFLYYSVIMIIVCDEGQTMSTAVTYDPSVPNRHTL